jgi:ribonuclease HI
MSVIEIFTDGSCLRNPNGPGGWAAIVRYPDGRETEMCGADPSTTNNRMEMTAALEGLKAVAGTDLPVIVYSDSQYVCKGMSLWMAGWIKKNWKSSTGAAVLNKEIWEELNRAARGLKIEWKWVRGHDGHAENERVDVLAGAAARSQKGSVRQLDAGEATALQTEPVVVEPAGTLSIDLGLSDSAIAGLVRERLLAAAGKVVRIKAA